MGAGLIFAGSGGPVGHPGPRPGPPGGRRTRPYKKLAREKDHLPSRARSIFSSTWNVASKGWARVLRSVAAW